MNNTRRSRPKKKSGKKTGPTTVIVELPLDAEIRFPDASDPRCSAFPKTVRSLIADNQLQDVTMAKIADIMGETIKRAFLNCGR